MRNHDPALLTDESRRAYEVLASELGWTLERFLGMLGPNRDPQSVRDREDAAWLLREQPYCWSMQEIARAIRPKRDGRQTGHSAIVTMLRRREASGRPPPERAGSSPDAAGSSQRHPDGTRAWAFTPMNQPCLVRACWEDGEPWRSATLVREAESGLWGPIYEVRCQDEHGRLIHRWVTGHQVRLVR